MKDSTQSVGYIYLTTNLINGKKYIGLHKSNQFDDSYYGSGKALKFALKKYGKENFSVDVLCWCDSLDDLVKKEVELLKEFNCKASDEYYNLIDSPYSGIMHLPLYHPDRIEFVNKQRQQTIELWKNEEFRNKRIKEFRSRKLSQKTKDRISYIQKQNWQDPDYKERMLRSRSPITDEQRQKMSASKLGKSFTESHKEKISKSLINKPKSKEHSNKINKNPEKIKKTAEKHRGMKRSDVARENMSKAKKGKSPHNKGKKYYYNPDTKNKILCFEGEQPNGFIRGFLSKHQ